MEPLEEHIDAAEEFRLKHPHINRMKAWSVFQTEHADLLARRHLNRAGFFAALTSAEERQGPPQIAQPAAAAAPKQRRKRNSGSTSHNDNTKGAAGRKRDAKRDSEHQVRAKKTRTTVETWLPLGRVTARGRAAKHYQQEVLRVREDVKNPNGRTRQRWEVASYLFLTLSLYLLHLDGELASLVANKAPHAWSRYYNLASTLLGWGKKQGKKAWDLFFDKAEVFVNDSDRGLASDAYILNDARRLQPAHLASIDSFIAECHSGEGASGRVTLKSIKGNLLREFSEEKLRSRAQKELVLVDISHSVIRYALVNWLGYRWGKVRLRKCNGNKDRPDVIRTYLKSYADALQKERDGTHVIVYTDERSAHSAPCLRPSAADATPPPPHPGAQLHPPEPRPNRELAEGRWRSPRQP